MIKYEGKKILDTPDREFDAIHYKINIKFNLPEKKVSGTTTIKLTPFHDDFNKMVLDAVNMKIENVIINNSIPSKFDYDSTKLTIYLDKNYSYDDTFNVSISYYTISPQKGMYFVNPDGKNPSLPVQIWTQGQADEARYWIPCFDEPCDKATTEIIAKVNGNFTTLSNGYLVEEKTNPDGTKTVHWIQDKPHPTYLITFVAGEFDVIKHKVDNIPLFYYIDKKNSDKAEFIFGRTPEMIKFFSGILNYTYPWDKYAEVILKNFVAGGMENTSATSFFDRIIVDKRTLQDFSPDMIVAHELFHQWFGDLVTCKNWAELYLNEGFASYSECLWLEHKSGKDEALYHLFEELKTYLSEAKTRWQRPIRYYRFKNPTFMFDRHSYQKGALVVNMLRFELGDRLFFKTLSRYLKDYQFQPVETENLIMTIEKVTGRNMKWFFDQWVDKPGHPVLDVNYNWNEESKELTLNVKQNPDTTKRVPVFKFSTLVELTTINSRKTEKISITKKEESFKFTLDSKPLMVRFDKWCNLIKEINFKKTEEELLYQLKNDDDVIGRLTALENLKEIKTDNVKTTLAFVIKNDAFWAVRKNAISLLKKFKGNDVVETLISATKDKNSKVRRTAINALGKFLNDEIISLLENIFKTDKSYYVQAEIISTLSRTEDPKYFRFFEEALNYNSYNDIIRYNALRAMEHLNDKRTISYAMEYIKSIYSTSLRLTAIRILRKYGKENPDIEDKLIEIVKEGYSPIFISTVNALVTIKSRKSIPVLKEILKKEELKDSLKRFIKRKLQSLESYYENNKNSQKR